jgi:hypothetical protein
MSQVLFHSASKEQLVSKVALAISSLTVPLVGLESLTLGEERSVQCSGTSNKTDYAVS